MSELYRYLPSTDRLLASLETDPLAAAVPRPLRKDIITEFLDILRRDIRENILTDPDDLHMDRLLPRLHALLRQKGGPRFTRVLNATGVVVHTNLGRSLLSDEATQAVHDACAHYSNLEFDLTTGKRGSRYSHVEDILCRITGAEAALVVNNNAAAVLIVLDTLASGHEAVVSRGELIEIGGSFRIPDVMARSGATLVEVGTTNRTHPHDYENAITENTGVLMKVHTSNFRVVGFTKDVGLDELVSLGRKHDIPVIEDLGSGNFFDFAPLGMGEETTAQKSVASGADVVTFSGDKVLGGPQAGIIAGRHEIIEKIKRNPLNRALRIDKMTLAALEATMRLYLDIDEARCKVPTLAMITTTPQELEAKAHNLADVLRPYLLGKAELDIRPGASRVGGGAFPERDLPTTLVSLAPSVCTADQLKDALLSTDPPLVGRIEDDRFALDPRTLGHDEFEPAARSIAQALNLPA